MKKTKKKARVKKKKKKAGMKEEEEGVGAGDRVVVLRSILLACQVDATWFDHQS